MPRSATLDPVPGGKHTPAVANERFSSGLIDEGGNRSRRPPLPRLLLAAVVLFVAGALLVWLFFYLIANL